jgi:hypothetical protein
VLDLSCSVLDLTCSAGPASPIRLSRSGLLRLAVCAASLVAVAACAGDAKLEMGSARSEIARSLERTYDLDVDDVRCPDSVPAEDGQRFTCTVTIGGQPLTVAVRELGADGRLRVAPTAAVLLTAQVQADLLEELADRLDDPRAKANCGRAPVRVVLPGRSFECRVADGGSIRVVIVNVRDVNGSLTFQLH